MTEPNVASASLRVIIVDDDAASRRLLARSLEKRYAIEECESGREALQLLEADGPALLVLDYQMPEINGAQVCEIIRASREPGVAQTPIIMLTAHSNSDHEVECLRAGADDFVTKPVNLQVLHARLDTHLRLHAMREQLLAQKRELENWRARHEEDLEAARLTQQAILPQRLPVVAGWSFGAHYHPLMQIGGDIYDWTRGPDGALVAWMSDATGHGASAALLTTLSKLMFRHAALEARSAAELMDHVEREFQAVFKGRSFMTAACLMVLPGSGRVLFCGAGQPPLLVAGRDGKVRPVASGRPPLGLLKAGASAEETHELAPGESVLLYTDGLYELQNASGARLGHEALTALLPPPDGSASRWLDAIIARATAYAGDTPAPDDIAAFAAMYEG